MAILALPIGRPAEGGAEQVAELVVEGVGVAGPELDGALAGDELGVAVGEAGVARPACQP